jgi:hypothetical protein
MWSSSVQSLPHLLVFPGTAFIIYDHHIYIISIRGAQTFGQTTKRKRKRPDDRTLDRCLCMINQRKLGRFSKKNDNFFISACIKIFYSCFAANGKTQF